MELLKSPKLNSSEVKESEKSTAINEESGISESKDDTTQSNAVKDDPEDLAEDFSDFGDSDDEILNQEETDSREGGEVRDGDSRPDSRLSQQERKRKDGEVAELEDMDTEEATSTSVNETEETIQSNAKLADALGADWSQLMPKEKPPVAEAGDARKRWSLAEIIKRTGLSKAFLGEEEYNRTLEKLNANLPEDEKIVLLDPVAGLHVAKRRRIAEREKLMDLGGVRALSARADMNIRRKLNGIVGDDTGIPPPKVNTNMELFNTIKERMNAAFKRREQIEQKVDEIMMKQKQLVC